MTSGSGRDRLEGASGLRTEVPRRLGRYSSVVVNHVFVQPHFDDVALACGGTVASLASAGDATWLVTVFSAGPRWPRRGGPLARELHALWGTGSRAPRIRAAEDDAAAEVLGAVPLRLGFRDATYRGRRYKSWEHLYGGVHRLDRRLSEQIAHRLEAEPIPRPVRFYVPLGLSRHVDHRIVRAAGDRISELGESVRCYEDFGGDRNATSAERPAGDPRRGLVPEVVDTADFVERKLRAVQAYRSQLGSLFGAADSEGMAADVDPALGDLRAHEECLWREPPVAPDAGSR